MTDCPSVGPSVRSSVRPHASIYYRVRSRCNKGTVHSRSNSFLPRFLPIPFPLLPLFSLPPVSSLPCATPLLSFPFTSSSHLSVLYLSIIFLSPTPPHRVLSLSVSLSLSLSLSLINIIIFPVVSPPHAFPSRHPLPIRTPSPGFSQGEGDDGMRK